MPSAALPPNAAELARNLLIGTRVDGLAGQQQQQLLIFNDTATVQCCLSELAKRRLTSAPVVRIEKVEGGPAREHSWPSQERLPSGCALLGFIDVKDVISSYLGGEMHTHFQMPHTNPRPADLAEGNSCGGLQPIFASHMLGRMRLLEAQGHVFAKKPLNELRMGVPWLC